MLTVLRQISLRLRSRTGAGNSSQLTTKRLYAVERTVKRNKIMPWTVPPRVIGLAVAGLILGGYYVAHLETAPETGRRRFMPLTKQDEEYFRLKILYARLKLYRGNILPVHHPTTQLVRRITQRILTSSNLGHLEGEQPPMDSWRSTTSTAKIPRPLTDTKWVVLVVDDADDVNALATIGLVCIFYGRHVYCAE
ncbi:hypothetical protein B0H16DRAFT_768856 [Mycena metata]|uniref:Uncharacterized protein n=1 Tax=Mycena metata TaxID=1033252 RepID=A0AAD7NAE4_9AGAR|nr:hypothetical protein B0H16DRAFT_768856 [Mycena metata]